MRLEFVFFERSQRGGSAAQDIVFGLAVEDVDAAVVQQGGAGDEAARLSRTDGALGQGFLGSLLHRLEAMATRALVFVQGHR